MRAVAPRRAECSCGQLHLEAEGDPIRISVCHCLACQRRTGSAFGAQARFPAERVRITGRHTEYVRLADDDGEERRFRFCPDCGATVFWTNAASQDLIAVPLGAFADPAFPPPTISVYEARRHPWVELADTIERDGAWEELRPLYDAGEYERAADRGSELVAEHPASAHLAYNVACCESLAGRTADAIEHLRLAVGSSEELRRQAAADSDLDPLRGEAAFRELVG
jgi:hypothetical protein